MDKVIAERYQQELKKFRDLHARQLRQTKKNLWMGWAVFAPHK